MSYYQPPKRGELRERLHFLGLLCRLRLLSVSLSETPTLPETIKALLMRKKQGVLKGTSVDCRFQKDVYGGEFGMCVKDTHGQTPEE